MGLENKPNSEVTFTAMIMARTNSTRAPNKNLRPFANSTLIDIALEKLNDLDCVQDRVLAVAEDVFVEKCEDYPNIRVLKRTMASIAKGNAPLKTRFAHYAEIKTTYCIFVNPGHPMLSMSTLANAIDHVRSTRLNTYTSVIPSTERIFSEDGDPIVHLSHLQTSTTEGSKRYKMAHAFHFINPEFFRRNGYLWTMKRDDPSIIVIPEEEAIDVDTEHDFVIAELYYRNKLGIRNEV